MILGPTESVSEYIRANRQLAVVLFCLHGDTRSAVMSEYEGSAAGSRCHKVTSNPNVTVLGSLWVYKPSRQWKTPSTETGLGLAFGIKWNCFGYPTWTPSWHLNVGTTFQICKVIFFLNFFISGWNFFETLPRTIRNSGNDEHVFLGHCLRLSYLWLPHLFL